MQVCLKPPDIEQHYSGDSMLHSHAEIDQTPSRSILWVLGGLSGIICLFGLSFALHALLVGHEHVFGTTREVPWGILISCYVLFACMSTGLCVLSSLNLVFNIQIFSPLTRRTVFLALITMAAALLSITLELENPWRVGIFSFLNPHPSSNIWWKSTMYSSYMFLMLFAYIFLIRANAKVASRFGLFALIIVTLANLNMNSDMALIGARGFWREQYMPLFFLTLSLLSATGAVMFFTWFAHKLSKKEISADSVKALGAIGKVSISLLVVSLFFVMFKYLSGVGIVPTDNPEAMDILVKGEFSRNFWLGEVGLAVVVPLILLTITKVKNPGMMALAGISIMVGTFVIFYDLAIVGQLVPHFSQYNLVHVPKYYSYSPSFHELMIMTGGIFFVLTAFFLGEALLSRFTGR